MTEYEDKNGRFRSYEHRYPPTAAQIAAGYEESTQPQPQGLKPEPRESKRERCESEEYNMKPLTDDKYMGVPAPNYICNRCGKKGHHLQACPTNMDPSFDRPPGDVSQQSLTESSEPYLLVCNNRITSVPYVARLESITNHSVLSIPIEIVS